MAIGVFLCKFSYLNTLILTNELHFLFEYASRLLLLCDDDGKLLSTTIAYLKDDKSSRCLHSIIPHATASCKQETAGNLTGWKWRKTTPCAATPLLRRTTTTDGARNKIRTIIQQQNHGCGDRRVCSDVAVSQWPFFLIKITVRYCGNYVEKNRIICLNSWCLTLLQYRMLVTVAVEYLIIKLNRLEGVTFSVSAQ